MNSTGHELANFGINIRHYARELDIPKYVIDMMVCLIIIVFIIVASVKRYLGKRRVRSNEESEPRIVVESLSTNRRPRSDDGERR